MLEMRFDDEVVKDRIKAADTNIKNHWFGSTLPVVSQSL
ncbi:hypothetical protein PC111_g19320 [Phytophthora cactorum]|uniref:Uncharacterized protein n=1 Tax=Phytophthora cactorum TaxID=29920 RepID=A0A8T1BHC7_9STRA|nr:hypothetical protein PC111_g19320 [Phytophthora cactorum]KAG2827254.1 hypothetical protein PC112_g8917 [Phytophthora cactorum]KAG2901663.1 hypothetical protein PC115_g15790 [Phytophthora cactorum]KAG3060109.1 hypothetical protein PC122_g20075 [Phytophthora cactorum]KAG3152988.1 hypothetical protein PC128_g22655 [Phytophthora cactorum]